MKKILSAILALTMVCAFAGCNESSSASDISKTKESENTSSAVIDDSTESPAETSPSVSEPDDTTQPTDPTETGEVTQPTTPSDTTTSSTAEQQPSEAFKNSYTYKFQQTTKSAAYSMGMTMEYMGTKIPLTFEINGQDFHMVMNMSAFGGETETETYYVGGNTYALNRATKTYSVTQGESGATMQTSPDVTPAGDVEFISSSEENGMIVEKMKITTHNASGAAVSSDATYYYDKATGEPKKVVAVSGGVTSTVEITSFKAGAPTITLPDFTGWTKIDSSQLMTGNGQQY